MLEIFFIDLITFLLKLFKDFLDVNSIPDHYDICQQVKAPGCNLLLFFLLLTDHSIASEPKINAQVMELLPFIELGVDSVSERQLQ